jgi:NlpC/P60 family putative phage cell wall peptidase
MTADGDDMRARVVAAARNWLGTPYHHQASVRAVGCDCLGLIRGIWADVYGVPAPAAPAYSRDWAEATGQETLLQAALAYLDDGGDGQVGDVLVFRYRSGLPAKHCGIRVHDGRMIHALEGVGVVEVTCGAWWQRRVAGQFRFKRIVSH